MILRLLNLDFCQAQAEAVAGLRGSEPGQVLDGDDHVLGGDGFSQRHGEVSGREAVGADQLGAVQGRTVVG